MAAQGDKSALDSPARQARHGRLILEDRYMTRTGQTSFALQKQVSAGKISTLKRGNLRLSKMSLHSHTCRKSSSFPTLLLALLGGLGGVFLAEVAPTSAATEAAAETVTAAATALAWATQDGTLSTASTASVDFLR